MLARGIFPGVRDLACKLRRYISAYPANAKPMQWRYSDPTRRTAVTLSLPHANGNSQIVIVMPYVRGSKP